MASLLLILAFLYVVFVSCFFTGMNRLARPVSRKRYSVSVVVAARNEERDLRACLDALLAQDYRGRGPFEIVVVDDRSTDGTSAILAEYAGRHPDVRVVRIAACPAGFGPKKHALGRGIAEARGEIVCTTDADCAPPPTWVSCMLSYFDEGTGFVAGPTLMFLRGPGSRWLEDFVHVESLSGVVLAAGGIGWNAPWTCSGTNLAYRKRAFEEVGGFHAVRETVSGDDDLLMFLLFETTSWRLRYALAPEAVVRSYENYGGDLSRFAHQRARRMSKFAVYPLRLRCLTLLLVLFYATFTALPVYVVATGELLGPWLALLVSRFGVELTAMWRGARRIGAELRLSAFARAFLLHPIAIATFAVRGNLARVTTWQHPGAV